MRNRPADLVKLYGALEDLVKGFGDVEIFVKGKYALFRTTRIFADVVFMKDALRLALLLDREVESPIFFKTGRLGRRIAHVTKIRTAADLRAARGYLREAYRFARSEEGAP